MVYETTDYYPKSVTGKGKKERAEALERLIIKEVYVLSILIGFGNITRREEALKDIRSRGNNRQNKEPAVVRWP